MNEPKKKERFKVPKFRAASEAIAVNEDLRMDLEQFECRLVYLPTNPYAASLEKSCQLFGGLK